MVKLNTEKLYPSRNARDTYFQMGDQFLVLYLSTHAVAGATPMARCFIMGHTLELYAKSVLANKKSVDELKGHKTYDYLVEVDSAFEFSAEELQNGQNFFAQNSSEIDLGVYFSNRDVLEIYAATHFTSDMKYYISQKGDAIFPAVVSTLQLNPRFIQMVRTLRNKTGARRPVPDDALREAGINSGIDENVLSEIINEQKYERR